MRRKFLVNIAFLLTVSVLVKAFWVLGIDRTVQNVVGEAEYGSYFSLFSFSVLFTLLLDMGLSGFNNRAVSADPTRVRLWFGNVLLLRLLLTGAYFTVTMIVAVAIGYSGRQLSLLMVLMLNQVMVSMILWLRSNISGMQYLFLDSLISVADRLVMIIICSVLLWGGVTEGPFRIEWFVWSQTTALFIVMCVSLVIVIRRGGVSGVRPDARILRSIITAGLPYAVVVLAMTLYWRIDAVLIERLLPDGAQEAGIYAQAFRLFDAFAMIPVMFGGLLLPIMSKELSAGNNIKPLVTMAVRMLLPPLGAGAVTLVSYSDEILDLLYVAPTTGAKHAFVFLMLALIPVGLTYIYSTVLTASGRFRLLGLITVGGMILNILLNLVLIPGYQSTGAACTVLVTQAAVAIACVLATEKTMFPTVAMENVMLYLLMLGLTSTAGGLFRLTGMPWIASAALQFITGLLLALTFRLVEPLKSLKLIFERADST